MLVRLHDELLQGGSAMLDRLRSTAPAGTSSSRSERVHLLCLLDLAKRLCLPHMSPAAKPTS